MVFIEMDEMQGCLCEFIQDMDREQICKAFSQLGLVEEGREPTPDSDIGYIEVRHDAYHKISHWLDKAIARKFD